MAVRDRNLFAWQAYVLTLSIISAGLLVGMFFLWNYASGRATAAEDAAKSLAQLRSDSTLDKSKVRRLAAMITKTEIAEAELKSLIDMVANDADVKPLEEAYNRDMALLASNADTATRNYQGLSTFLMSAIRERNQKLVEAEEREKKQEERIKSIDTDAIAKVAAADAARDQAVAELEKGRNDHQAERERMTAELEKVNQQLQKNNDRLAKVTAEAQRTKATLESKIAELTATVQAQAEKILELTYQDFEAPQGKIVSVSDGGRTVWINIGRRAGLRENIRFAVLSSDSLKVTDAKPKAFIVITKVVEADLAQARVVEDNIKSPIVPGDMVYSPAWQPGRKVHYALLGLLDIDEDLVDDREEIRGLISLNDGVVDEELMLDGRKVGPGMTTSTRFLVVGPSGLRAEATNADGEMSPAAKAMITKYNNMKNRAKELGATEISVDKLLGYLRATGENRTIPLGSSIRGNDFPAADDNKDFFRRPIEANQVVPARNPPR